jgi:hypothetical protein
VPAALVASTRAVNDFYPLRIILYATPTVRTTKQGTAKRNMAIFCRATAGVATEEFFSVWLAILWIHKAPVFCKSAMRNASLWKDAVKLFSVYGWGSFLSRHVHCTYV